MNDKKLCQNCGHLWADWLCHIKNTAITKRVVSCPHWTRSPCKWISILPTEPGIYWFKTKGNDYNLCEVYVDRDNELFSRTVNTGRRGLLLSILAGKVQFQGPIAPKEAK